MKNRKRNMGKLELRETNRNAASKQPQFSKTTALHSTPELISYTSNGTKRDRLRAALFALEQSILLYKNKTSDKVSFWYKDKGVYMATKAGSTIAICLHQLVLFGRTLFVFVASTVVPVLFIGCMQLLKFVVVDIVGFSAKSIFMLFYIIVMDIRRSRTHKKQSDTDILSHTDTHTDTIEHTDNGKGTGQNIYIKNESGGNVNFY